MTENEKLLSQWFVIQRELKALKARELELRKHVFGLYFDEPVEGVNTAKLGGNYILKGTHKINRTIDLEFLDQHRVTLHNEGLPMGLLIAEKPSLVKKEFNELTEEQKIRFSIVLTVTDGTPDMKIEELKV